MKISGSKSRSYLAYESKIWKDHQYEFDKLNFGLKAKSRGQPATYVAALTMLPTMTLEQPSIAFAFSLP